MRRPPLLATLLVLAAGGAAVAQETGDSPDCAALGLANAYLTEHFCAQLQALGDGLGQTRSITQEGNPDADSPVSEWDQIGLIQDAYRADPRKTLELIERIKGAGGLTSETSN